MKKLLLAAALTIVASSAQAEIVGMYTDIQSPSDSYTVVLSDQKGGNHQSCPPYPASRMVQVHGDTASRGRFMLMAGCWYVNENDDVIILGHTMRDKEEIITSYKANLFQSSKDFRKLTR